ncbi:MAG: chemotaxis response regulator (protein-glutamate methylesterase), partial [Ilumatobacteraceae bacterium]|nr:chemotaxis response regulator (protein-glutamate methylesterase) [Ilumatobacteraceae bacterium]
SSDLENALEAIALVAELRPHVVTMDLQIPAGGGQFALEQIMATNPTPVLVLSSSVQGDASAEAVESLFGGALIAMPKPMRWTSELECELRKNIRTIQSVPVIRHIRGRKLSRIGSIESPVRSADGQPPRPVPTPARHARVGSSVVAIAASTGGPPALAEVLGGLGQLTSPILIVQHIHPDFVQGLIAWMARITPVPVVLAEHGQVLRESCIYIGPGNTHLKLGSNRRIELAEQPVTTHRPSADQLFESVARHAGPGSVGVLLTGMGDDGAAGLAEMRRQGAHTIAQDQASSAVYGMPRAAMRLGAVDQQLPLPAIADAIIRAVASKEARR